VPSFQRTTDSIFVRTALASGLVSREQIDEAAGLVAGDEPAPPDVPTSDERLADKLVELGHVNAWQVSQLRQGRTKFTLGPYRIIDSIGRGGMGQVFKAQHNVLGRVVAIKVLPRAKSTPEAVANFTREMRTLAKLDHENLVRAYDAGEDGNVHYLVTEYVPGSDLRKMVRSQGRMDMRTAAKVISQVAAGLEHAHQQGLIHRDVKPGNVLVTPGGVAKLSDLGLAGSLRGDAESDPRFGKIVGTADYLSPDHIQAPWAPTPAWDVYSLGCTLYYAVTGKVPFPRGATRDKVRAHCELRPIDPRRLNASLEAEFVEVLGDMMAKHPAQRIPSAAKVIERLRPWTGQQERVAVSSPGVSAENGFGEGPIASSRDGGDLEDTQSSFPEIAEADREGSGWLSQTTDPVGSASQETGLPFSAAATSSPRPPAVWGPMLLFFVLPLGLVALLAVLWHGFQAAQ